MTPTHHPSYDARRRYYARVRWAMVVAVLVHGIAFAAAPEYTPRPAGSPPSPLRLITVAGEWRTGTTGVGTGAASAPAEARTVTQEGARIAESRVTTEPAEVAVPFAAGSATDRAGTGLQSGAPAGGGFLGGSVEDEAPPVFYNFDTAPRATRTVEPEYPAAARVRDQEGTVVVNVNIDERGRILRAWVAAKDASASEYLVTAALDAAYQFEFTPGKQRGIPVKCTVAIPFRFKLRDNG